MKIGDLYCDVSFTKISTYSRLEVRLSMTRERSAVSHRTPLFGPNAGEPGSKFLEQGLDQLRAAEGKVG